MKKTIILLTLIFTVMFSSPSYAEWTKVSSSGGGANTFYVDFERIRKHGGYVYYWDLIDFLKPDKYGHLSSKTYKQGDCKLFRHKSLSYTFHKEPMGGGTGVPDNKPDKEWTYPSPESSGEIILKSVCSK
jgi:hypothetical protein